MNRYCIAIVSLLMTMLSGMAQQKPNIVFIYADDLGYGDVSCYGAKKIHTPHIDRVAAQGIRFTNVHASSATCTPSRYSVMTGEYAWRKKGTGIAPGDAALLIQPGTMTLPLMLRQAGYTTAAVGKWHLGLGEQGAGPQWNGEISPGPLEIGFNSAFLMPATTDRVPTVFVKDHHVVNLDPADPIEVSYKDPIGHEPTGREHPELLKMKASHGHDQTIVNGIGRIGYMSGGKSARWVDEDIASVLVHEAKTFIREHSGSPFFLYLATHDIHVPRVPNGRFYGKSGLGVRGDAILQLDWTVGEVLDLLDSLRLADHTLIIFSSDNGPVLDDGYQDSAVAKLNGHRPAGVLRGGKYSAFDAGTRVPFLVRWPGKVKAGKISPALISQVDLLSSLASLTGQSLQQQEGPDSQNMLDALLGRTSRGRDELVEHANTFCLIRGRWKYIEPHDGPKINHDVDIELGTDPGPQLYDLEDDPGEKKNVAAMHPDIVKDMAARLAAIKGKDQPFGAQ